MAKSESSVVAKELRNRTRDELQSIIAEKQLLLMQSRFKKMLGQLTNSRSLKDLRRDIARVKTVMTEQGMVVGHE